MMEKRDRLKQWIESGELRLHPLSLPQRELWECSPVPVESPANHICAVLDVRGLLTPPESVAALQQVVDRQEALRLSFLPGKSGPLQAVRRTGEAQLHFRDAPGVRSEAIDEMAEVLRREPFDLLQGPLYRAQSIRAAADEHYLLLSIHHAIADGWTLGVFVEDLCGAYVQALAGVADPLPPVPLTYTAWSAADRATWRPEEIERRLPFWRETLKGAPRVWPDLPEVSREPLVRRITMLPAAIASGIREISRRAGATLFSTLLTAFHTAFWKWNGADDLTVGSPVANRGKQAARETMGYFAGVIPLRRKTDPKIPFLDAIRDAHNYTADAFGNALPFVELARALGDLPAPGRHPLFQVRFALQNHPVPDVNFPRVSARLRMRSTGTARFDLGCEITEQGEALEIVWLHSPARCGEKDVSELHRLYTDLLSAACKSPESPLEALL